MYILHTFPAVILIVFFTEIIWRFYVYGFTEIFFLCHFYREGSKLDFTESCCLSHKMSVNFTQNLQEKCQVYIHILWDLSTEHALKLTDLLRSYKSSVNARKLQRKCRNFTEI